VSVFEWTYAIQRFEPLSALEVIAKFDFASLAFSTNSVYWIVATSWVVNQVGRFPYRFGELGHKVQCKVPEEHKVNFVYFASTKNY